MLGIYPNISQAQLPNIGRLPNIGSPSNIWKDFEASPSNIWKQATLNLHSSVRRPGEIGGPRNIKRYGNLKSQDREKELIQSILSVL